MDTKGRRNISAGCDDIVGSGEESDRCNCTSAWAKAMEVLQMSAVSFGVLAAVKLKVFDVLAKHAHQPLSASQILSHVSPHPPPHPPPPNNASSSSSSSTKSLDRLLRLLASHSLLTSSLSPVDPSTTLYGLTPSSQYFIQDHQHGSLAPLLLLSHHKTNLHTGENLSEAILGGVSSFSQAHGDEVFTYAPRHPEYHQLLNSAMVNHSELLMRFLLRVYHGFDGLSSIVDVGGGFGACVNAIVEKYPHIKGINFDQPHVIQAAPTYPAGVQHVPGDMFDNIPQADAVFMKWILHDWSDEECIKILKNCYAALPTNGKVILVDAVLPNTVDTHINSRLGYGWDQFMLLYSPGGRERSETELRELAQLAGFFQVQVSCKLSEISVMEMYKASNIVVANHVGN